MLYINLFPDGDALLETVPQGEASIPLKQAKRTQLESPQPPLPTAGFPLQPT